MATKIYSFGYRHGLPDIDPIKIGRIGPNSRPALSHELPDGYRGRVIDVRRRFNRNPYHDKKLRCLRGDNPLVEADILKTPEFAKHYAELKAYVEKYPGEVFLGCTGGHHRSVYLASRLGRELGVPVRHLNYNDK